MFGGKREREIGYRIEVTLLDGTLKVEESGVREEVKREGLDLDGRWMLRIGEAAELVGVSRSKMYILVASRQVGLQRFSGSAPLRYWWRISLGLVEGSFVSISGIISGSGRVISSW